MDNKSMIAKFMELVAANEAVESIFVWRCEAPKVWRVAFDECMCTYNEEKDDELLKATKELYLEQEQISEVKMTDKKYHGYIMGNLVGGGYYILCDDNINRAAEKVKYLN